MPEIDHAIAAIRFHASTINAMEIAGNPRLAEWKAHLEYVASRAEQAKWMAEALGIADSLLREIMYQHADPDAPEYNECDKDLCEWCVQARAALARHKESKSA